MPDIQIEYHQLAIKEGRAAWKWYADRSLRAAENFEAAVRKAIAEIQDDPARWPQNSDGTRFRRTTGYPYLIIYRQLNAELVRVFAIAHSRRRFGYWSRRK